MYVKALFVYTYLFSHEINTYLIASNKPYFHNDEQTAL